jgi:AraC-like DNA-binding protein
LAGSPNNLIANPGENDALSDVLRSIRLTGALQFCFMPSGTWQTDGKPRMASLARSPVPIIPFHVLVEGGCWLQIEGQELVLAPGDIVAFPHATGHALGVGRNGLLVTPTADLPPKPWPSLPILRYGDGKTKQVRLLCGYLKCEALNFGPLRESLPKLIHVRTSKDRRAAWLGATLAQIVEEVDRPNAGGLSMLERLTEITFIELLRHQILASDPGSSGWLAALADPSLGRCLARIHDDPRRDWTVQDLTDVSGLSRSTLAERFEEVLGTSPMRYVRDWRLYLASVALGTTRRPVAAVAHEAGYGTEAAFNRAFSRAYGVPPATWRQGSRKGQ